MFSDARPDMGFAPNVLNKNIRFIQLFCNKILQVKRELPHLPFFCRFGLALGGLPAYFNLLLPADGLYAA